MRSLILITSIFLSILACQPNPRYRSGELPPRESHPEETAEDSYERWRSRNRTLNLDSGELIELGRVLQEYLGRPYKSATRDDKGLDCSRFTMEVFRKFNGTELPRSSEEQYRTGTGVNREKLEFGDLLFFRINGREISHVGIYVNFREFIHASESLGIVISSLDDEYWRKHFAGARRIL